MPDDEKHAELYRPLNDGEQLTIRAELRQRQSQLDDRRIADAKEGQKLFSQHHHAVRLAALNTAADHGKAFVRYVILLHGGALVALIALIGALHGKSESSLPRAVAALTDKLQLGMYFFVVGLVCAAMMAGIAFFQWIAFAGTYFGEGHTSNAVAGHDHFSGLDRTKALADFNRMDRASVWLVYLCATLGSLSIFCFGAGAIKVAKAFAFYGLMRA